jgi:hypothetical protein
VTIAKTPHRTGLIAAGALVATKMKHLRRWLQDDGSAEDERITRLEILLFIVFVPFFLWVVRLVGKTGLLMDGF